MLTDLATRAHDHRRRHVGVDATLGATARRAPASVACYALGPLDALAPALGRDGLELAATADAGGMTLVDIGAKRRHDGATKPSRLYRLKRGAAVFDRRF